MIEWMIYERMVCSSRLPAIRPVKCVSWVGKLVMGSNVIDFIWLVHCRCDGFCDIPNLRNPGSWGKPLSMDERKRGGNRPSLEPFLHKQIPTFTFCKLILGEVKGTRDGRGNPVPSYLLLIGVSLMEQTLTSGINSSN